MCWECEDDTVCWYCGNECYGTCDDPDKCPTCWPLGPVDILEAEFDEAESCLGDVCDCECHKIIREADILLDNELDLPEHPSNVHAIEGIFPFLSLPGEIREKIYGLVFAQKGNQRFGQYHRGHIHTALLQTCRQINQEARHLPLKFNQISFPSPYQAVEFVGFKLKPRMYDLITKIHIEYHMYQDLHHAWCTLIPVLEKMKITHLALTIKGPVTENYIKGHTCTTERFKGMKHLKTVKVEIPSAILTAKTKTECIEYITKKLIKAPDPNVKKGKKRAAAEDAQQKLTKWVKCSPDKKAAKSKLKRKSLRLLDAQPAEIDESQRVQEDSLLPPLLLKYNALKDYATSIDAVLVSIRLEWAGKAAKEGDEKRFAELAQSILGSLEERFAKTEIARKALLNSSFS